jgi:hypothetical protein
VPAGRSHLGRLVAPAQHRDDHVGLRQGRVRLAGRRPRRDVGRQRRVDGGEPQGRVDLARRQPDRQLIGVERILADNQQADPAGGFLPDCVEVHFLQDAPDSGERHLASHHLQILHAAW